MGALESRLAKAEQKAQKGFRWIEYTEDMDLQHVILRYKDDEGIHYTVGTGVACLPELLEPCPHGLVDVDEIPPIEFVLWYSPEESHAWIAKHRIC